METIKKYKLGVICGRLCHEHLGHKFLIDEAISKCNKVLVLVGSAQEYSTLRNPFSLETRIKVLRKAHSDISEENLKIYGLTDMTNEQDISYKWGNYVIDHIYKYTGEYADYMITGDDDNRKKWFSKKDLKGITQKIVSRNQLKISATVVRGALLINDKVLWRSYVPNNIYDLYDYLREELLSVPVYKEIYDKLIYSNNLSIDNFLRIYSEYELIDKNKKIEEIK